MRNCFIYEKKNHYTKQSSDESGLANNTRAVNTTKHNVTAPRKSGFVTASFQKPFLSSDQAFSPKAVGFPLNHIAFMA